MSGTDAPGVDLFTGVDALAVSVEHEALSAEAVVEGAPRAGVYELGTFGGTEIGVWEMTPGIATDTEADEIFVVLAGRAQIAFLDPAREAIHVGPGSVVRLMAGMRTEWTVTETLRKVYVA